MSHTSLPREDEDEVEWDDYYDYDPDDYLEEQKENEYLERAEFAATCKCGAWQFDKKGNPVHVADCCCGAE